MRDDRYVGRVDMLIDGKLSGWALNRSCPDLPCPVDVYVNSYRVGTFTADRERKDLAEVSPEDTKKGFVIDLTDRYSDGDRIEVYFGNTNLRIPLGPRATSVLTRSTLDVQQFRITAHSPFVPVPENDLVTHVGGIRAGNIRETYLLVGSVVAADIYNRLSDVGIDLGASGFHLVDLGCGCGRIASFLAPILGGGQYSGFDVWDKGIEWAQKNISAVAPYMSFVRLANAEGGLGYEGSRWFPMPLPSQGADAVVSTSVFTHLDEAAIAGYLSEIGRILKPGGGFYVTCHLRDQQCLALMERIHGDRLERVDERHMTFWRDGSYLDSCVDLGFLMEQASANDLQIALVQKGAQRGPHEAIANSGASQDLILGRKLSAG